MGKLYNKANSVLWFIQHNLTHGNHDLKELPYIFLRVDPVAVTGSPNLLCCILRYFSDFAFCCCVI